jgi:hypothetical protein
MLKKAIRELDKEIAGLKKAEVFTERVLNKSILIHS